jgi:hypothetical protein
MKSADATMCIWDQVGNMYYVAMFIALEKKGLIHVPTTLKQKWEAKSGGSENYHKCNADSNSCNSDSNSNSNVYLQLLWVHLIQILSSSTDVA